MIDIGVYRILKNTKLAYIDVSCILNTSNKALLLINKESLKVWCDEDKYHFTTSNHVELSGTVPSKVTAAGTISLNTDSRKSYLL